MQSLRARTERLWKDYLRDPSRWFDFRKTKINPRAPDFQHKSTREFLWLDGWYNPSWVKYRLMEESIGTTQREEEGRGKMSVCTNWKTLGLDEALVFLEEDVLPHPSIEDIRCILTKCRSCRDPAFALRMHACVHKYGLETHEAIANDLVLMLQEVGRTQVAREVLENLSCPNVWSWPSLIENYGKFEKTEQVNSWPQLTHGDDFIPLNELSLLAILKVCSKLKDFFRGLEVHAQAVKLGFFETNPFIGSTLVDLYAKCGLLVEAQSVFDKISIHDVVAWTALLSGYAKYGYGAKALEYFEHMRSEGVPANDVTFIFTLLACADIGAIDRAIELHAEIERKGLLEGGSFVGSTLVDFYAKHGMLSKAQSVLDNLPARNVASWNALIGGYAQQACGQAVLKCYERMQYEGFLPNAITFVCSLKACASLNRCQELHEEIERKGLLDLDVGLGNALVDMYAKCGMLIKARAVFAKLPNHDEISWTALITRFVEHGHGEQALECLQQMQAEYVRPNTVTFVASLKACGSVGAVLRGEEMHGEIERRGLLESNSIVGNALVDMYTKCGLLVKAQGVFDKLPHRDIVAWNVLLTGYAQLGEWEKMFHTIDGMLGEGFKPDPVTCVVVLNTCSRTCLRHESQTYFGAMREHYGVIPTNQHHACMVDLFARAGEIDRAMTTVKKLSLGPNLVLWRTVLSACSSFGNLNLGKQAFKHVMLLDNKDPGAYALMSLILADHSSEKGKLKNRKGGWCVRRWRNEKSNLTMAV